MPTPNLGAVPDISGDSIADISTTEQVRGQQKKLMNQFQTQEAHDVASQQQSDKPEPPKQEPAPDGPSPEQDQQAGDKIQGMQGDRVQGLRAGNMDPGNHVAQRMQERVAEGKSPMPYSSLHVNPLLPFDPNPPEGEENKHVRITGDPRTDSWYLAWAMTQGLRSLAAGPAGLAWSHVLHPAAEVGQGLLQGDWHGKNTQLAGPVPTKFSVNNPFDGNKQVGGFDANQLHQAVTTYALPIMANALIGGGSAAVGVVGRAAELAKMQAAFGALQVLADANNPADIPKALQGLNFLAPIADEAKQRELGNPMWWAHMAEYTLMAALAARHVTGVRPLAGPLEALGREYPGLQRLMDRVGGAGKSTNVIVGYKGAVDPGYGASVDEFNSKTRDYIEQAAPLPEKNAIRKAGGDVNRGRDPLREAIAHDKKRQQIEATAQNPAEKATRLKALGEPKPLKEYTPKQQAKDQKELAKRLDIKEPAQIPLMLLTGQMSEKQMEGIARNWKLMRAFGHGYDLTRYHSAEPVLKDLVDIADRAEHSGEKSAVLKAHQALQFFAHHLENGIAVREGDPVRSVMRFALGGGRVNKDIGIEMRKSLSDLGEMSRPDIGLELTKWIEKPATYAAAHAAGEIAPAEDALYTLIRHANGLMGVHKERHGLLEERIPNYIARIREQYLGKEPKGYDPAMMEDAKARATKIEATSKVRFGAETSKHRQEMLVRGSDGKFRLEQKWASNLEIREAQLGAREKLSKELIDPEWIEGPGGEEIPPTEAALRRAEIYKAHPEVLDHVVAQAIPLNEVDALQIMHRTIDRDLTNVLQANAMTHLQNMWIWDESRQAMHPVLLPGAGESRTFESGSGVPDPDQYRGPDNRTLNLIHEEVARTHPEVKDQMDFYRKMGYKPITGAKGQAARALIHPDFHPELDKYLGYSPSQHESALRKVMDRIQNLGMRFVFMNPLIHKWNVEARRQVMALSDPHAYARTLAEQMGKKFDKDVDFEKWMQMIRRERVGSGGAVHRGSRDPLMENQKAAASVMGDPALLEPVTTTPAGMTDAVKRIGGLGEKLTFGITDHANDWMWEKHNRFADFAYLAEKYRGQQTHGLDEMGAQLYAASRSNAWVGLTTQEDWKNEVVRRNAKYLAFAPGWWRTFAMLATGWHNEMGLGDAATRRMRGVDMGKVLPAMYVQSWAINEAANHLLSGHSQEQNQPENRHSLQLDRFFPKGKDGKVMTIRDPLTRQADDVAEVLDALKSGNAGGAGAILWNKMGLLAHAAGMATNLDIGASLKSGAIQHYHQPEQMAALEGVMSALGLQGQSLAYYIEDAHRKKKNPWDPATMKEAVTKSTDNKAGMAAWAVGINSPFSRSSRTPSRASSDDWDAYQKLQSEHEARLTALGAKWASGGMRFSEVGNQYRQQSKSFSDTARGILSQAGHGTEGMPGYMTAYEQVYQDATMPDGEIDWAKVDQDHMQLAEEWKKKLGFDPERQRKADEAQKGIKFPVIAAYKTAMNGERQFQNNWATQHGMDPQQLREDLSGYYAAIKEGPNARNHYLSQHRDIRTWEQAKKRWVKDTFEGQIWALASGSQMGTAVLAQLARHDHESVEQLEQQLVQQEEEVAKQDAEQMKSGAGS